MMTFQPAQYTPIGGTGSPDIMGNLQNMLMNYLKGNESQQKVKQMQQEMQYYPQLVQAQLAHMAAANQLSKAQAGHLGAQTNEINQTLKYLPLNELMKANEQLRLSNRFDAASKLIQAVNAMPQAQKEQWMGQHADEWNQAIGVIGSQQGNQLNYITPEVINKFFPGVANQPQGLQQSPAQRFPMNDQQIQNRPQEESYLNKNIYKLLAGVTNIPESMIKQRFDAYKNVYDEKPITTVQEASNIAASPLTFPTFAAGSKEDIQKQKDINLLSANQRVTDPQIQGRATAAVALDKFINDNRNEFAPKIRNAVQYAGAIGRGQKFVDQLMQKSPQAYQDYVWYQTTFKGHLANLIKQQEHLNGNIKQREELHSMVDFIDRTDLTPEAALKEINAAFKSLNQLSNSVYDAAEPINKGVYKKVYNIPEWKGDYVPNTSNKTYSLKDLEHTAQKHNMTVEQVKQKLGVQ